MQTEIIIFYFLGGLAPQFWAQSKFDSSEDEKSESPLLAVYLNLHARQWWNHIHCSRLQAEKGRNHFCGRRSDFTYMLMENAILESTFTRTQTFPFGCEHWDKVFITKIGCIQECLLTIMECVQKDLIIKLIKMTIFKLIWQNVKIFPATMILLLVLSVHSSGAVCE